MNNPQSFWEEARYQRVCASCDRANGTPDFRGRTWQAHHVLAKRFLTPDTEWDPRNALRLCTDCHYSFEHGGVGWDRFPARKLVDANFCFLWEVLGADAIVVLGRHYIDIETDPRWQRHRVGECELCARLT